MTKREKVAVWGIRLLALAALGFFINLKILTHQEEYKVDLYQHWPSHHHLYYPSPTMIPITKETQHLRDVVEVNWPKQMQKESSDSIILLLAKRDDHSFVRTINREGHESKLASPNLIDDAQAEDLYNHEYETYATAKLIGTNFNIASNTPDSQMLNRTTTEWRWNISPTQDGEQLLNLSLEVEFRGKDDGKKFGSGPLRLEEFTISVYKPWITRDSLNIISLVNLIVGAGLTIPWLYERFKERKKRKSSTKAKGRKR